MKRRRSFLQLAIVCGVASCLHADDIADEPWSILDGAEPYIGQALFQADRSSRESLSKDDADARVRMTVGCNEHLFSVHFLLPAGVRVLDTVTIQLDDGPARREKWIAGGRFLWARPWPADASAVIDNLLQATRLHLTVTTEHEADRTLSFPLAGLDTLMPSFERTCRRPLRRGV